MTDLLMKLKWGIAALGGGVALLTIMVLTVVTVFGRYVLHADLIPGGYNMIGAVFFPLLVFWGLPLAHAEGSFPRMEVLDALLPERGARIVRLFYLVVECVIYAVVLYYCALFAMKAWDTGKQLQIGTQLWMAAPVYVMAPLAFALILLEVVTQIVRAATGQGGK